MANLKYELHIGGLTFQGVEEDAITAVRIAVSEQLDWVQFLDADNRLWHVWWRGSAVAWAVDIRPDRIPSAGGF